MTTIDIMGYPCLLEKYERVLSLWEFFIMIIHDIIQNMDFGKTFQGFNDGLLINEHCRVYLDCT
jgi:hypothetical protein